VCSPGYIDLVYSQRSYKPLPMGSSQGLTRTVFRDVMIVIIAVLVQPVPVTDLIFRIMLRFLDRVRDLWTARRSVSGRFKGYVCGQESGAGDGLGTGTRL